MNALQARENVAIADGKFIQFFHFNVSITAIGEKQTKRKIAHLLHKCHRASKLIIIDKIQLSFFLFDRIKSIYCFTLETKIVLRTHNQNLLVLVQFSSV